MSMPSPPSLGGNPPLRSIVINRPERNYTASENSDMTDSDAQANGQPSEIEPLDYKNKSVRAIVCIGRYSNVRDNTGVQRLHDNNRKLYNKFVHYVHPHLHECQPGDCPKEPFSIVFNGWSSTVNMSKASGEPFVELKDVLTRLAKEKPPGSYIALIFCSPNGLFTNTLGVHQFFEPFKSLNIVLHMYTGGKSFQEYLLSDVLNVIGDFAAGQRHNTPAHKLVLDWMTVFYNKAAIRVAKSDIDDHELREISSEPEER